MEIRELNEKEMISIDGGKNWRKIGEGIIEVGVGTISITGHTRVSGYKMQKQLVISGTLAVF